MPNHFHAILYSHQTGYYLNKIIGNGRRLIAYEIKKRLKDQKKDYLLEFLAETLQKEKETRVNYIRYLRNHLMQKQCTIKIFSRRHSTISITILLMANGIWNDYADYENSSASFYELGIARGYKSFDFRVL